MARGVERRGRGMSADMVAPEACDCESRFLDIPDGRGHHPRRAQPARCGSSRAALTAADLVIGPRRGVAPRRGRHRHPGPAADPDSLSALPDAGFHVATLAGNHIRRRCGPNGIGDTVATLRALGFSAPVPPATSPQPAPSSLSAPASASAMLSWQPVGPRESWATSRKAGCALRQVLTHYELDYTAPGGPPNVYTFAAPDSLEAMQDDITALRAKVDVVLSRCTRAWARARQDRDVRAQRQPRRHRCRGRCRHRPPRPHPARRRASTGASPSITALATSSV